MRRRTVIAGAASALALPAVHARAQSAGVALVIGNSKYQWESSLPNVKRDVAEVTKSFQALGLKTELLQDLGRDAMLQALARFKATATGANFAALYFAGHGIVTGDNPSAFMNNFVPADADLSTPAGAKSVLAQHTDIVPALDGASARLAVFDACRNNPADGWRNRHVSLMGARGVTEHSLSRPYKPETLLLFSTAPGYIAPDGPPGQNSPFAAAFLRQLAVPPVDLLTLAGRLRRDLLLASQGRQVAYSQSTVTRSIALAGKGMPVPAAGYNPASVVEFPNAYAMARQVGLPISAGLVGYRAAGSNDAQKVGAYRFEYRTNPAIFIVLSAEGGQAETVSILKDEGRAIWRYVHATVSGDTLSYLSANEENNNSFRWSDANSGTWTSLSVNRGPSFNSRFTRID